MIRVKVLGRGGIEKEMEWQKGGVTVADVLRAVASTPRAP